MDSAKVEVGDTLGVEEEFHVVDADTGALVPGAQALLRGAEAGGDPVGEPELQRSMVETASDIHTGLDALRADLVARRCALREAAEQAGMRVLASGSVPDSGSGASRVYPAPRYEWMAQEYRQLVLEQQVCACQVQVGVPDRDLAVRLLRRLRPWLSTLLAMTGSSPFFAGVDTGYASYRSVVVARWPTGGPPPDFDSVDEYDRTVASLVECGVISDAGMIYFDVRPSARYPTLEIRIGDGCPLVDDAVLLAGVARALVTVAAADEQADRPVPEVPVVMLRAASWRAARSGLGGQLVDPVQGRALPAAQIVRGLLEYARPALEERGDWVVVDALATELCQRGTSAQRQRGLYGRTGSTADVVAQVAAETAAG